MHVATKHTCHLHNLCTNEEKVMEWKQQEKRPGLCMVRFKEELTSSSREMQFHKVEKQEMKITIKKRNAVNHNTNV